VSGVVIFALELSSAVGMIPGPSPKNDPRTTHYPYTTPSHRQAEPMQLFNLTKVQFLKCQLLNSELHIGKMTVTSSPAHCDQQAAPELLVSDPVHRISPAFLEDWANQASQNFKIAWRFTSRSLTPSGMCD
jgi:hypothetical protein